MTTFAKTWNTAVQRGPVDQSTDALQAQSSLWDFFASMLGLVGGATGAGLMTVDSSCDSVAAGAAGDGVNRLGTTFANFNTHAIHANAGSAHSWFVLHSAQLGLYILVNMNFTGAPNQNDVWFSYGTAFSAGTTTNRPTSAKEFQVPNGANVWAPPSSATGCKFISNIAADGSFFWLGSNDSSGGFPRCISVVKLSKTHADDTVPSRVFQRMNNSGSIVRTDYNNNANLTSMRDGANGTTCSTGLTSPAFNVSSELFGAGNLSGTDAETDSGANLYDDDLAGVYVDQAGHKSRRGYLEDFWWAPSSLVDGQCEPQTGGPPYKRMVVAHLWFPVQALAALPNL